MGALVHLDARRRQAPPLASASRGSSVDAPGLVIVLASRPGGVSLIAAARELLLTPAKARELARELVELADDAEAP